jgi:branched-chain amino acid transport system permease protein
VLLPEWLRSTEGLYLILYALSVMVLMAFCPSGLLGLAERAWNLRKRAPVANPAVNGADPAA